MKHSKLLLSIVLVIVAIGIVGSSIQASAQENVIRYLDRKFKEENIPVVEITVLEEVPLRLRIVVQSADEWTTTEDMVILNSVERAVFIDAPQEGYIVESLVSILQDSQGKQLDYTEQSANDEQIEMSLDINKSSLKLTDEETKVLLMKKIDPFLDEYHLRGTTIMLDVFSKDGDQTVSLELQASSLDIANNAAFFFWVLPNFALFDEVNAEGANMVSYRARIIDQNGANLLDLIHDFQLGSGGWTQSEKLMDLGNPPPSSP
jgi:hypothetical protein